MYEWTEDTDPETIAEEFLEFRWMVKAETTGYIDERHADENIWAVCGGPNDNVYAVEQYLMQKGVTSAFEKDDYEGTKKWVIACPVCPDLKDGIIKAMSERESLGDCYRAAGRAVLDDGSLTLCHGYASSRDGRRTGRTN